MENNIPSNGDNQDHNYQEATDAVEAIINFQRSIEEQNEDIIELTELIQEFLDRNKHTKCAIESNVEALRQELSAHRLTTQTLSNQIGWVYRLCMCMGRASGRSEEELESFYAEASGLPPNQNRTQNQPGPGSKRLKRNHPDQTTQ